MRRCARRRWVLMANTAKKKKAKVKRAKDEPKERLQEKPKPVDNTPAPAPTVNPALGTTPMAGAQVPAGQAPASSGGSTPQ